MRWFRSSSFVLIAPFLPLLFTPFIRADGPTAATSKPAINPAGFFDPARHMLVSEVTPGMTGYGLTVFQGSKIERFEVEVVSILHNFNAKSDVVLIRCKGEYLEHTGSIAGMSGSPVYLKDAAGHDRMIGAFAYGWPLTKDPVAGVQPIEYMLRLPVGKNAIRLTPATTSPASKADVESPGAKGQALWSLKDAGMLPLAWRRSRAAIALDRRASSGASGTLTGDGQTPRLEALATPLMTGGMSPKLFEELAPRFRAAGLAPLEAGIGGSGAGGKEGVKLEPGSVLAVPLLTGDVEMTAIGTTTEVIGDHVWGFGHPFNNEGLIALPMGSGQINGIIANLQTSFKLGSLTQTRGTLTTDGSVGVAGEMGARPSTIPIEISVESADGFAERTYHFNASRHPKFTPMIAASAFSAAVAGASEMPQFNTVDYTVQLTFANGQTVTLANRSVNASASDLFGDAAVVMQAASDNPFQRVMVNKITGTVKVRAVSESAQIIDVNLPKSHFHPGDKVKAFVTYQPFHATQKILPVELELPHDLPNGPYQIIISDAQRYFTDEQQYKPFRFMAENIGDVFAVLKDAATVRENAIYLRLVRQPDGVAIGRTALSHLPSSRREILLASGASNTTPFVSSSIKIIPTELVMAGSAEFEIDVETSSKVTLGAPKAPKVEPPAPPAIKGEEPKKSPGVGEAP